MWETYAGELSAWAGQSGVTLPTVPTHCEQPWHLFYLLLASLEQRQRQIAHLRERGILAVFHYLPLHTSDMGRQYDGRAGDCPVTEDISDRLFRLPLYFDLTEDDQPEVIETVQAFAVE